MKCVVISDLSSILVLRHGAGSAPVARGGLEQALSALLGGERFADWRSLIVPHRRRVEPLRCRAMEMACRDHDPPRSLSPRTRRGVSALSCGWIPARRTDAGAGCSPP